MRTIPSKPYEKLLVVGGNIRGGVISKKGGKENQKGRGGGVNGSRPEKSHRLGGVGSVKKSGRNHVLIGKRECWRRKGFHKDSRVKSGREKERKIPREKKSRRLEPDGCLGTRVKNG